MFRANNSGSSIASTDSESEVDSVSEAGSDSSTEENDRAFAREIQADAIRAWWEGEGLGLQVEQQPNTSTSTVSTMYSNAIPAPVLPASPVLFASPALVLSDSVQEEYSYAEIKSRSTAVPQRTNRVLQRSKSDSDLMDTEEKQAEKKFKM